jgi:hypothetical protein
MGVAVEGSAEAWPGASAEARLPEFDAFNRPRFYVDVFNRGQEPFAYTARARQPWITLSAAGGTVSKEERIWVSIDWTQAPKGSHEGAVIVARTGGESVEVKIPMHHPALVTRATLEGFVESNGHVSIEAEHFTRHIPAKQARWEKIEGYGRTLSAMSILPVTASSVTPPGDAPCLEYRMYLFTSGKVTVRSIVAPTLNFLPGRGLRYAVSFDDETPQVIDIVPRDFDARNGNREWEDSVRNASRTVRSTHELPKAGYHTLKIRMVDPAVVLQKIVVDLGGVKPSYLGPPESYFGKSRSRNPESRTAN